MNSERLGRRSLPLDAAYCAGAGIIAVLARRRLARSLGVAPTLVVASGATTLVWAGGLVAASRWSNWRAPVAGVAIVNAAASAGLAAGAVRQGRGSGRLVLAGVSAEVAAFAVVQAVALQR